jgi:hypothetical protein
MARQTEIVNCNYWAKIHINWDYRISEDVGGFYASYLRSRLELW